MLVVTGWNEVYLVSSLGDKTASCPKVEGVQRTVCSQHFPLSVASATGGTSLRSELLSRTVSNHACPSQFQWRELLFVPMGGGRWGGIKFSAGQSKVLEIQSAPE